MEKDEIKRSVRKSYTKVAKKGSSCCGNSKNVENISTSIGYSLEELKSIPDAANMGLGCGNPTAIASLKEGEIVLDLGSGGGLDVFLAANKVGVKGKAIGVDMTPDMIDLARENAIKNNYENVEFRLGEIEHLPIADSSIDVVISNCVINLSPEKQQVFNETFRVLKPGGRISISDMVLLKPLPESIKENKAYLAGCIAGAELKEEYLKLIKSAGFEQIEVKEEKEDKKEISDRVEEDIDFIPKEFKNNDEELDYIRKTVQSIIVTAFKPE
jgi:arsenite methyltransferase